jgi:hypothetical protein
MDFLPYEALLEIDRCRSHIEGILGTTTTLFSEDHEKLVAKTYSEVRRLQGYIQELEAAFDKQEEKDKELALGVYKKLKGIL